MKRVFISYPYSDDPPRRMSEVKTLMRQLYLQYPDLFFISPHLAFQYIEDEDEYRDEIMCVCFDWIALCDELWVYGDSEGCREEIQAAEAVGIKIKRKEV